MKTRNDYIFYGVFFFAFTAIFLLNNNRGDIQNEKILNIILACFTLVFLFLIVLCLKENYVKFTRNDIFLFSCLIFCAIATFVFRRFVSLHWVYLLTAFCITKLDIKNHPKYFNFFVLLGFISIIIQFLNNQTDHKTPVLSWQDPNYSGLVIFLFVLLLHKLQKKYLVYIALLLGILTLSRAFFVSTLIFLLLRFAFVRRIALKPFFFNAYFYFVVVLTTPFVMAPIYLNYFNKNQDKVVDNNKLLGSFNRLTASYLDNSNKNRFTANVLFLKDIIKHPQNYILGMPVEEYVQKVFRNSPHNIVGQLVLSYGLLFTFFYLIILFRMITPFFTRGNEFVFFPLLIYLLLLGGVWIGISLIFFAILLKINFNNEKN